MNRDEIWDDLKTYSKQKFDADRAKFLSQAVQKDDGSWTKHTEYHWSRTLKDKRLDYWPSRKKYQYGKLIRRGDVYSFIRKILGNETHNS